jgi:hypothetical protein
MVEALNIPFIGPNLYLAPHGDAADRCLHVALVGESDREELSTCLTGWQRGTLCRPRLTTHTGRHLHLEWTGFAMHFDDQMWPENGDAAPSGEGAIDVSLSDVTVDFLEPGLPVGA